MSEICGAYHYFFWGGEDVSSDFTVKFFIDVFFFSVLSLWVIRWEQWEV